MGEAWPGGARRAFLNGRMDLTAAEAVIDLIEAETAQAARNAVEQLGGSLRRRVEGIYDKLLEVVSRFYAVVDYPDEDIEDAGREEIDAALAEAEASLRALLATANRGRVLRSGVPAAIVGQPNVGKSSLLNALVGYDRAIVTDVAGTTRDTVEEKAVVGGVLLRLIDTAGIRESTDQVERLGVDRSRQAMAQAQLVLAVLDGSRPVSAEDLEVLREIGAETPWLLIWSKADLWPESAPPALPLEGLPAPAAVLSLSARTGAGLEDLASAVEKLFPAGEAAPGQILTNTRQEEAVSRALAAVSRAREALAAGLTPDAALTDGEEALSALGELTGRTVREDMVERIFERFCVGK